MKTAYQVSLALPIPAQICFVRSLSTENEPTAFGSWRKKPRKLIPKFDLFGGYAVFRWILRNFLDVILIMVLDVSAQTFLFLGFFAI